MRDCKCEHPEPYTSSQRKDYQGNCAKCGGRIPPLEEVELVDAERWLQARIYRPKERIRAIERDGKWYVYDGVQVHEFTDEQFKETYELAAQSCQQREIDKKTTVYEYH